MIISFTVPGLPVPKAYGRSAAGWYISKSAKTWENAVGMAAKAAVRAQDPQFKFGEWTEQVYLTMTFWLPIPASDRKIKAGMPHCRKSKGDGANLYKSTEDALKRILFADDGQVSHACWWKVYGADPSVDIRCELVGL